MKHIEQLREIAPYIQAHQNTTMVILLSGEVQQLSHYHSIIKDILLLHSIGVRLVLVFGCRPQIDAALSNANISSEIINGRRITNADQIDTIIGAVATMQLRHNCLFSATANVAPLPSTMTSLVWGNWIAAQSVGIVDGIDFGHTGKVRKLDTTSIEQLLDSGQIVACHSLASTSLGELCNLSSEDIAEALARSIHADKLILFARTEGLDQLMSSANFIDFRELGNMLPDITSDDQKSLLQLAINACIWKVRRVHLINSHQEGALLKELFTRDGSSLMVTDGTHQKFTQAKPEQIPAIHELIRPMEEQGFLRIRDLDMLEQQIEDYYLLNLDQAIIGCAALHPLSETIAELACFVIAPEYQGMHKGFHFLTLLEQQARRMNITTLAVLTTQTKGWFEEHGFVPAEKTDFGDLFASKRFDPCRNARLFTKNIKDTHGHTT